MKLIILFVTLFIAVVFFSCSNDKDQPDSSVFFNSGDALIEYNLKAGATTYASDDDEKLIKNSEYRLYNSDGSDTIPLHRTALNSATKISFIIAAADITSGDKVKLVVVANTKGFNMPKWPGTLDSVQTMIISGDLTNNSAALLNGLPASQTIDYVLDMGRLYPSVSGKKLERAAARFYVKGDNLGALAGATLQVTAPNSVNIVTRSLVDSKFTSDFTYTIASGGATQTIGYVFPSTIVPIRVLFGGKIKTVTIPTVSANTNYGITITPGTEINGWVDFDITVDQWGAGKDFIVDLN